MSVNRMSEPTYNMKTMLGDFVCGWRDGRKGLPEADPSGRFRSARLDELISHQDEVSRQLDHALEVQTIAQRSALIEARHRLADIVEQLKVHEAKLKQLYSEGPSTKARLGEESLGIEFSLLRRQREFNNLVQRRQALVTKFRTDKLAVEAEADVLNRQILGEEQQHQAVAERYMAFFARRVSKYLAGVSRTHPDPAAIAQYYAHREPGLRLVDDESAESFVPRQTNLGEVS